jgi:4-azaleucine resistance transporter AzlC
MSGALSRRALLLEGARDTVPMLVGAAPFGVIFGTLAVASGLSATASLGMSLLVFAGSSQFIGVSLIGAGTALPVLWLTTFVVNLRHALYSATLLPFARDWPLRWRWPLAFWLTDETFAVVEHRFRTKGAEGGQWYWLASSLAMYGNWVLWTAVGVSWGSRCPAWPTWGWTLPWGRPLPPSWHRSSNDARRWALPWLPVWWPCWRAACRTSWT